MTERERIARVFGIEPLRPAGAIAVAAAMGLIPMAWIASAGVAFGLAAIYADEQRKIAAGLAEVQGWGFPVTGYRDWLLAREPAFDLELRRDVNLALIEGSFAAVDPSIVIERRGERVVRVVMRRVEVRIGDSTPTFLAGDRARLRELRDRVLGPLHADVGIAAMRMGEREWLGALVAAPVTEGADGNAFRDQAIAAPPDLQSLVHAGTSQLRPPSEARSLKLRHERLLYATGQVPASVGGVAAAIGTGTFIGMCVLAPLAPFVGLIGGVSGAAIVSSMKRQDRARLDRALGAANRWSFLVEGYEDWLLSGRPICDIEFVVRPERALFEHRLHVVARVAELTWLSETLLRMESQPILHHAAQGIPPFWGGDPRELQQLARTVLAREPAGVAAVRMGGYLDRRV